MKKLIALLLALTCVLGLVACSGATGGNNGGANLDASDLSSYGDPNAEGVVLTIGLPVDTNVQDLDNNALTKYLEEKTGYEIKFEKYADPAEIASQITTATLAGKKLPDILFGISLGGGAIKDYGENGQFVDLAPLMNDDKNSSKIFWDRLNGAVEDGHLSEFERSEIIRKMTDIETGAIYAVPSIEVSPIDVMDYQVWINQKWLDKLNLKMPTNTQELYDVLVAFKENDCNGNGNNKDEIPLTGAQRGTRGSDVVGWLTNLFLYYDNTKGFNIDENGKVYPAFVTDEYRNALKYIHKLYSEGLLADTAFNNDNNGMGAMTTPANGIAKCGIFVGHLTLHTTPNNMVLKEYVPLKPLNGQTCVYNANTFNKDCIITTSCENVAAAFRLLMEMRTEEASLRVRYGEYGVNWIEAEEGAVSDMGYPAKIKILDDPFGKPNQCMWVSASGSFTIHAEGESALFADGRSEWELLRSKLHAESAKNYAAAAAENNPKVLCPSLQYTPEEQKAMEFVWQTLSDIQSEYTNNFMKAKLDPNVDANWNKYLNEMKDADLQRWIDLAQKAYDRQLAKEAAK